MFERGLEFEYKAERAYCNECGTETFLPTQIYSCIIDIGIEYGQLELLRKGIISMPKFKIECFWTENHSGEFVIDAVNKKEVIEYLESNPKRLNYTLTNKSHYDTIKEIKDFTVIEKDVENITEDTDISLTIKDRLWIENYKLGREKGKRKMCKILVKGKFNDTPDSILELIDEVDLEKIDEVIDIILETDDPEKVEEILKK